MGGVTRDKSHGHKRKCKGASCSCCSAPLCCPVSTTCREAAADEAQHFHGRGPRGLKKKAMGNMCTVRS